MVWFLANRRAVRAHPRECGEHSGVAGSPTSTGGSSPRVRGAYSVMYGTMGFARLIPASAGSMQATQLGSNPSRAHPRECGEHMRPRRSGRLVRGSSPRVRGAWQFGFRQVAQLRLIPASAGSIQRQKNIRIKKRAHPRECGEHYKRNVLPVLTRGSSPRVRGAFNILGAGLGGLGLIPASAGSIPDRWWKSDYQWAHPRECGEHSPLW